MHSLIRAIVSLYSESKGIQDSTKSRSPLKLKTSLLPKPTPTFFTALYFHYHVGFIALVFIALDQIDATRLLLITAASNSLRVGVKAARMNLLIATTLLEILAIDGGWEAPEMK